MSRLIALAFVATLASATASQAAPLLTDNALPDATVIQVSGGCGFRFHRGPYGGCRQNWPRPWLHACARGWHVGPYGGCVADFRRW
jgi:hypothetical protein